jgi:outer membrane protein OmpA-like peptidoglycan-associated protein
VGEATIAPADYRLLTKVQRAIRTFGNPRVTIEGHTDSTGGAALNERLSQERAESVRDYLVANNVLPMHRIVAVGRASEDPLATNETKEGRALNRRIDVILDTRRILFIASK